MFALINSYFEWINQNLYFTMSYGIHGSKWNWTSILFRESVEVCVNRPIFLFVEANQPAKSNSIVGEGVRSDNMKYFTSLTKFPRKVFKLEKCYWNSWNRGISYVTMEMGWYKNLSVEQNGWNCGDDAKDAQETFHIFCWLPVRIISTQHLYKFYLRYFKWKVVEHSDYVFTNC